MVIWYFRREILLVFTGGNITGIVGGNYYWYLRRQLLLVLTGGFMGYRLFRQPHISYLFVIVLVCLWVWVRVCWFLFCGFVCLWVYEFVGLRVRGSVGVCVCVVYVCYVWLCLVPFGCVFACACAYVCVSVCFFLVVCLCVIVCL